MTRAELDAEWARLNDAVFDVDVDLYPKGVSFFNDWLYTLVAAERAIVDREVQARAIRWAAQDAYLRHGRSDALRDVCDLANRVEAGELEVSR